MTGEIAILGLGEVGRCYAEALAKRPGIGLRLCDPVPSASARALASRLGLVIESGPGPWLADSQWVFNCVPGTAALAVAASAIALMRPQQAVFADFTTADPQAMRDAAGLARARRIRFVDVAILGAIASTGAATPLLAAGDASGPLSRLMQGLGAAMMVLDDAAAGDAASLKLMRSAFTKGLEALTVEVLCAAQRRGLREPLFRVLSDLDATPLTDTMKTLVRTHVVHARRRRYEVAEVRRQFELAAIGSELLPGVEQAFARTVAALDGAPLGEASASPNDERAFEAALRWLVAARSAGELPAARASS